MNELFSCGYTLVRRHLYKQTLRKNYLKIYIRIKRWIIFLSVDFIRFILLSVTTLIEISINFSDCYRNNQQYKNVRIFVAYINKIHIIVTMDMFYAQFQSINAYNCAFMTYEVLWKIKWATRRIRQRTDIIMCILSFSSQVLAI